MSFTTLISTEELAHYLGNPNWAVIDCRFALTDPAQGRANYLQSHIAGAVYADLERDLSGPVIPGKTGRHPLPPLEEFVATLGRWGIDEHVQVVAYDDASGMVAGRLWWMLRYLGHRAVAVLDGDWRAWQREGWPVSGGEEHRTPRVFTPRVQTQMVIDAAEIAARLGDPTLTLLDARARDRFRGENETLDPKAGHIPGALSAPYVENLDSEGYFRSDEELRGRFTELLEDRPAGEVALYCGSGVTAAHNSLAMVYAGLAEPRLYVGSWSDWITDPARPTATGQE